MAVIPLDFDEVTKERIYRQEWLEYFHYVGWDEARRSFPLQFAALCNEVETTEAEQEVSRPTRPRRAEKLNVTRREDAMRFVADDEEVSSTASESGETWSDFESSSSSSASSVEEPVPEGGEVGVSRRDRPDPEERKEKEMLSDRQRRDQRQRAGGSHRSRGAHHEADDNRPHHPRSRHRSEGRDRDRDRDRRDRDRDRDRDANRLERRRQRDPSNRSHRDPRERRRYHKEDDEESSRRVKERRVESVVIDRDRERDHAYDRKARPRTDERLDKRTPAKKAASSSTTDGNAYRRHYSLRNEPDEVLELNPSRGRLLNSLAADNRRGEDKKPSSNRYRR